MLNPYADPASKNQVVGYPESYLGSPAGFLADRDRQTRKIDRVLELTGFEKLLATEESRTAFIDSLAPNEFVEGLEDLNGMLINVPYSHRGFAKILQYSGELDSVGWGHPVPEDKEQLLHDLLAGAQSLSALPEKALLLAVGINAIHPFEEGNGRVSRLVYYLLTNGYRPRDTKLAEVLGPDGDQMIVPNPTPVITPIMSDLELNKYHSHTLEAGTGLAWPKVKVTGTEQDGILLGNMRMHSQRLNMEELSVVLGAFNGYFGRDIVTWLAAERGYRRFKKHLHPIEDSHYSHLFDFDSFTAALSMADIDVIRDLYASIKRDFVHKLIDAFKDPQTHQALVPLSSGEVVSRPIPEILYLTTNHLIKFGS